MLSFVSLLLAVILFILWFVHGLIEWHRDRKWRSLMRNKLDEDWRQVPPPNWRSSRGGRDYF